MSELPDPVQTLLMPLLAAAAMFAAAPQLFVGWLRRIAEQQRAAVIRQQAIQEDLLRRMDQREIATFFSD